MSDSFAREFSCDFFLDDPMDLEVRISTNWRSEMRIILERETKVAIWRIRISCFCHLWEEKPGISIELDWIMDRFKEFSDMGWFEYWSSFLF